jgi:hypothetical protein
MDRCFVFGKRCLPSWDSHGPSPVQTSPKIRPEFGYNEWELFRDIHAYKECISKISIAVCKEKYDVYYSPHTAEWRWIYIHPSQRTIFCEFLGRLCVMSG